jgi:penicillin-binding protein 2
MVANRGTRIVPHIVLNLTNPKAGPPPEAAALPPFKRSTFESVIEGMWRSVNDHGTGQGARVEGLDACGKTGSTQVISRERAEMMAKAGKPVKTHSWFTGFAPRVNPRIVVTVLIEYGGGGGAVAGPVAGQMFSLWKDIYKK